MANYQDMWDKLLVSSFSGPTGFDIETESTTGNKPHDIETEIATGSQTEDSGTESTTGSETEDLKFRRLSHATGPLWKEAEESCNDHYRRDILAAGPDAVESLGIGSYIDPTWESHIAAKSLYSPYSDELKLFHRNDLLRLGDIEGAYDGLWAELCDMEFDVCVSKVWKEKAEEEEGSGWIDMDELYEALEADIRLLSPSQAPIRSSKLPPQHCAPKPSPRGEQTLEQDSTGTGMSQEAHGLSSQCSRNSI
jgi:hypothetical protein